MAEGQTYDIPEAGFAWFKDKMTKLGKRAEKLVGEKLFITVVGFHFEGEAAKKRKIMEVFVAFPEPKLAGWEFVARIDHSSEVGNVVRTTGQRNLPEMYRNSEPVCDHCGHKRRRRDTFVVHHTEDSVFKQVGSSCLKDFLGHGDADKWAKMAELVASIGEFARHSEYESFTGLKDRTFVDTEYYMQVAAYCVMTYGWVSKAESNKTGKHSTASNVFVALNDHKLVITDQQRFLAEKALEWARRLDRKDYMSDYDHNAFVVANMEALEPCHTGIAASIVGIYYKNKNAQAATTVKKEPQFIGQVGDRLEIEVIVDVVQTLENSYRHAMHDQEGNRYTWFATKPLLRGSEGKVVKIAGAIKAHNEFRGVKQNILTRVKAF